MSEYNLKAHELEIGKKYKTDRGSECYIDSYDKGIFSKERNNHLRIGINSRFKEIKKEPEFEALACFINFDSKTIFFKKKDEASEDCANILDYKVDGGKLFVRKRG